MKKTLIAVAVLAAATGAQAQSSVTIYGSVDVNYTHTSGTNGASYYGTPISSTTMNGGAGRPIFNEAGANDNSYLGFMGTEDLGGGLKATFQLEHRFNLANGASSTAGDFEGASNVGLAGGFGQMRFGRVNELSTETYRRIDPFNQNGVASALQTPFRGDDGSGRLGYTARYDSPTLSGFNFGASYTVKNGPTPSYQAFPYIGTPSANNGYALSATYTNGPLYLVANYNKAVNSSDSYNWNVGAAYAIGNLKLSLGYEDTKDKIGEYRFKSWLGGAAYVIGNGELRASYNHMDEEGSGGYAYKKFALGYSHNLSKRTSLYANWAHEKEEADNNMGSASFRSMEVGMNHKF